MTFSFRGMNMHAVTIHWCILKCTQIHFWRFWCSWVNLTHIFWFPRQLYRLYIYAFRRCFYPKRLTVLSGYTFFVSMCVLWELNPQPLRCKHNALTTEPQEHTFMQFFCQKCIIISFNITSITKYGILRLRPLQQCVFCQDYKKFWF